jgi:hypothetical protein
VLTRDEVLYASVYLPGMPLPHTVDLFMKNHFVIPYLFMFPWLGFMGLPLFVPARASYWDIGLFLVRFCAFVSVEIILIVYFSIACLFPLTGLLAGMGENEPKPDAWLDVLVVGPFWLFIMLILCGLFMKKGDRHN